MLFIIATALTQDDRGGTAVEYALMASAIAAIVAAVVFALGGQVSGLFENVSTLWASQS